MCEADIFIDVCDERAYQRLKWTRDHDAAHTPDEWEAIRVEYARRAKFYFPGDLDAYRKQLVKIAAVTVAEIENFDQLYRSETDGVSK